MSQQDNPEAAESGRSALALDRRSRLVREVLALDTPLLILVAIAFVSSLGVAVMVPLIPLYATSLGASPQQLGLLTSAFALTNALGQLAGGLLTDRFGARGFIRTGIAIYTGANVLIATAANAILLIAYRALAGLGAGFNLVSTRLYLAQVADPRRMAFVNGVLSAASSVGQVAGPAFGGIVTQLTDLRTPFLLVGATSGLTLLASVLLPRPAAKPALRPVPTAAAEPASWLNRSAVVLLVAQLFLLAGYGSFITTYAPFATQILGWSTLDVGILFSVFGLGSIALGPWLSHLADRTGRRRIAALSCLPVALFAVALVIALPWPVLYAVTLVAGGGLTAFTGAWFALLTEAAPGARRGRTFGIVNALSQLGVVAGATMASTIWESAGLGAALLSAAVPILLAGASMLVLPREEMPAI